MYFISISSESESPELYFFLYLFFVVHSLSNTIIFWFNIEWLGVGYVRIGAIIDGILILLHEFKHSNLYDLPYIQTASLPPTYEIISTSGNGSMSTICYTSINEGGYRPIGLLFSANTGNTEKEFTATPICALALKKKTGINLKVTGILTSISTATTTNAHLLVEVYKFIDLDDTTFLTGQSWVSVNDESCMLYDIDSTSITLTNGILIYSQYSSQDMDQVNFNIKCDNAAITTNNDGQTDVICIVVRNSNNNNLENIVCSATWSEYI